MVTSPKPGSTNDGTATPSTESAGAVERESSAHLGVRLGDAERSHGDARRRIPEGRSSLKQAEDRFKQWREDHHESEQKRSDAEAQDARAQRDAREAQRKTREARQQRPAPPSSPDAGAQERNRTRWLQAEQQRQLRRLEGDARRFEADARSAAQKFKKWTDDTNRKARELDYLREDVSRHKSALDRLISTTRSLSRQIDTLSRLRDKARAEEEAAKEVTALTVTRRAAQAITAILDKTEHSPGQPFRLVAHPDGKLSLTLGSVTEDDATFIEDGLVFLVTETPLHPSRPKSLK